MTVNFYSGSYTYTPTQYGTRTATRRVPYTATRQVPYQEEERYISSTPKVYYLTAKSVTWIYINGVRHSNVSNYKSSSFPSQNAAKSYFNDLSGRLLIPRDSRLETTLLDYTKPVTAPSGSSLSGSLGSVKYPDNTFFITAEWGSPIYSTRTVTKYRTESYTDYRTESYQESYVTSNAYSSVSCTGLTTSGTTGLINSSYTGRVLVSTDGANYTYYSGTSLNNLLTTSSTPVYTAILSESGSTLGLTNGSSYTKSTIESKVAEYNTTQGIYAERVELEKVASYLNNIRDTVINDINRKYNEFYNTGTRYYQDVKAIIVQAY